MGSPPLPPPLANRLQCYQNFLIVWNCSWKFVFIDRRSWNIEYPNSLGYEKNWYLTSWADYKMSQSQSCHWWSLWKFAEIANKVCILIWLNRSAKNQTFLENAFFSNSVIHRFFYWLIVCLHVNWMFITIDFDFTANWYWTKLKIVPINYIYILF